MILFDVITTDFKQVSTNMVVYIFIPTYFYAESSKVPPYPLQNDGNENTNVIVKVPLPPRSLLVMYGSAR